MGKTSKVLTVAALVAFAVALGYTALYINSRLYVFGDGSWQGIVLVLVWLLVAVLLLAVLVTRTRQRQELIRRYYLSSKYVFNHEIGYADIDQVIPDGDAYEFVGFAAESLAQMSYGFQIAQQPADFAPEFLVTSTGFRFHRTGDGIVIDQWRGTVTRIVTEPSGRRSFQQLGTYRNARQLARLLADNGAFARAGHAADAARRDYAALPLNDDELFGFESDAAPADAIGAGDDLDDFIIGASGDFSAPAADGHVGASDGEK